jgi:RHS repeat-associated protein
MRWVLMLFVVFAAVMGGEARAVVVMGRSVVSKSVGRAETVEERAEALRIESERASRGMVREVEEVAGFVDAGPLVLWFPGGSAVARSDCGDRQAVFSGGTSAAEYTETAAAGSAWTVPPAATVQHVRGPDLGGGTKGLLYSLRRSLQPNEQSTWLPRFNRYNGRGDVVAQSDIDGTTTWAASYQADGRRTAEAGTNVERHRASCLPKAARSAASGLVFQAAFAAGRCLPKATQDAASGLVFRAAFAAGRSKEEDPTGLLNEGFRYRDMETGTFISRDPLGHVDGPNVYCYVRQNPWTAWDPEGLFVGALVKRINEHIITPAAEGLVGAMVDALPQSAVEQLSSSRGFESAVEAGRTVSGGIMHGSQEALGMLSPMDGAADKLLNGDLSGAVKEAAIEAGGGKVFKAAGKGLAAVKRHAGKLDEAVGALSHADDAATATATGVRESIEEASSVLAKEGGGAAKSAPVGSTRHIDIPDAENGAYFGMLENGKAYVGKGPPSRARQSLRRKSREQQSPVDDIAHYPEADDAAAFKKEAELIEDLGGVDAPDLLNKRNSPGKKK